MSTLAAHLPYGQETLDRYASPVPPGIGSAARSADAEDAALLDKIGDLYRRLTTTAQRVGDLHSRLRTPVEQDEYIALEARLDDLVTEIALTVQELYRRPGGTRYVSEIESTAFAALLSVVDDRGN